MAKKTYTPENTALCNSFINAVLTSAPEGVNIKATRKDDKEVHFYIMNAPTELYDWSEYETATRCVNIAFAIKKNENAAKLWEHLRGRLYIRHGLAVEVRNGKRYAVAPADEWLISDRNIYDTREDAEAKRRARADEKARKQKRESAAMAEYMAERPAIIARLLRAAAAIGVEVGGVGFMTNEEIEREALGLERLKEARDNNRY